MKERSFQSKHLIRLQVVSWYLFLGCFVVATVLYALKHPLGDTIAFGGVIIVLIMTIVKILVLAEQFRLARLYRFWLLSYMLLIILLLTILLKRYFIQ